MKNNIDGCSSARQPKLAASAAVSLGFALLMTACATGQDKPVIPPPLSLSLSSEALGTLVPAATSEGLKVQKLPSPPAAPEKKRQPEAAPATSEGSEGAIAVINLEQVVLGTFAQVAYSEVLKKNVSIDPKISARRDLVTFRTGGTQTAGQIEQAVKLLLKSYGVAAIDVGGLVRIVPDDASGTNFPEIRRGIASPETPVSLRPIYHLVELQVVRPGEVTVWLRTIFSDRVKVQEDPVRNAILVSGNTENVSAALQAIMVLDQPVMAGRSSLSLTPAYWSADDLAKRLSEVLSAEGYGVQAIGSSASGGTRAPVILLPVPALNSVFVFASSDAILTHVSNWATRLDRPNERGIGKNFFTYAVKHKDASVLAMTLEQLLTGVKLSGAAADQAGKTAGSSAAPRGSAVVVDKSTNMLIFQASPDEYSQVTALLQSLDRPAKSALIEVTVAELTVDRNSQLGVEWFFNQSLPGGASASGGTLGGLAIGTSGFSYRVTGSSGVSPRVLLNALASDNKAIILSSPRVSARNGETATIQVGQEVPIITSQQSLNTTSATGNQGVLQTIQYRSTGVILRVKPAIHSGDQIDLDVSQEVSSAQSTNTGVNTSPTISTRKLETKLTLKNGTTVMLGGLISDDSSNGSAGIPFLKDVPVLGGLFNTQTSSGKRRELIVLITPYIINDQQDSEAITKAFRMSLGWAGSIPDESVATKPSVPKRSTVVDVTRPAPSDQVTTGTAAR